MSGFINRSGSSSSGVGVPAHNTRFQEDFSTYEMLVYTSPQDSGANKETTVNISLCGAGVSSDPLMLDNRYEYDKERENFAKGHIDRFNFQTVDFQQGALESLVLSFDAKDKAVWRLDKIELRNMSRHHVGWVFIPEAPIQKERRVVELPVSCPYEFIGPLLPPGIRMGPILGFVSSTPDSWKIACLIVVEGVARPRFNLKWETDVSSASVEPSVLPITTDPGNRHSVWKYIMDIPLHPDHETVVTYMFEGVDFGEIFQFTAPKAHTSPNLAAVSCNGIPNSSGLLEDMTRDETLYRMWDDMYCRHFKGDHEPGQYHLLHMGGDQVYSDPLWTAVGPVHEWVGFDKGAFNVDREHPFTEAMRQGLRRFFFDLYVDKWGVYLVQRVMARIPSFCMWDDHDIFDGWGSYPQEDIECPCMQGIFSVADEFARIFQMKGEFETSLSRSASEPGHNFSYGFVIGDMAFLVLDTRTERTLKQIMSNHMWELAEEFLASDRLKGVKHIVAFTSVPVVWADYSLGETLAQFVPSMKHSEDDFADHWCTEDHQPEQKRLIEALLGAAVGFKARASIISGDVHCGGQGVIKAKYAAKFKHLISRSYRNALLINNFTTSGIVAFAPESGSKLAKMLNNMTKHTQTIGDYHLELLNVSGEKNPPYWRRFIFSRNWLSFLPNHRTGCVEAEWFVDKNKDHFTFEKTVEKIGRWSSSWRERQGQTFNRGCAGCCHDCMLCMCEYVCCRCKCCKGRKCSIM